MALGLIPRRRIAPAMLARAAFRCPVGIMSSGAPMVCFGLPLAQGGRAARGRSRGLQAGSHVYVAPFG